MIFKNKNSKKHAIIIFGIVVCILAISATIQIRFNEYMENTYRILSNSLQTVEKNYYTNAEENNVLASIEKMKYQFYAKNMASSMNDSHMSHTLLNQLYEASENKNFYFINNSGRIIKNSAAPERDDIILLLEKSKGDNYFDEEKYEIYASADFKRGSLLIVGYFNPYDYSSKHLSLSEDVNAIVFDYDTKRTNSYSDERFAGVSYKDFNLLAPEQDLSVSSDGIGYNESIGIYRYLIVPKNSGACMTYITLANSFRQYARIIALQMVIIPIVMLTLLRYAIGRLKRNYEVHSERRRNLYGNTWLDLDLFYGLTSMVIVCALVTISLSWYFQTLISYSDQNVHALRALSELSDKTSSDEIGTNLVDKYFEKTYSDIADFTGWITENYTDLQTSEWLKMAAGAVNSAELSIYDSTGTIIASSNESFVGNKLPKNSDDLEYELWKVLQNQQKSITMSFPDSDYEYVASSDFETNRMVLIRYNKSIKEGLNRFSTFEEAFITSDFGDADKIMINLNSPSKALFQPADSLDMEVLSIQPVEEARMLSIYNGPSKFLGKKYYMNSAMIGDSVIICAIENKHILDTAIRGITIDVMYMLIMYIFLLCVIACFRYEEVKAAPEESGEDIKSPASSEDSNLEISNYDHIQNLRMHMGDMEFKKTIKFMFILGIVMLLLIFWLDSRFSSPSLLQYLESNSWNEGANIFSLTKIIFMGLFTAFIVFCANKLLLLVAGNVSQRVATIASMLCSLTQFAWIIFIVIYILVQLGFKFSSLVTGAGVAGACLAIAGQNVVADLLSGFFIIFEGKFGVGNWVMIDGYRGQIVDIGVRSTTVAFGGDIKIFNNSSIKGIVVYSHNMSGAICFVDIPYEADATMVIQLLKDSGERYLKEIPYITEKPIIHGITELGESGVRLRITAYVEDQNLVGKSERELRRVTKHILEENGISIPFPQIVVHNE